MDVSLYAVLGKNLEIHLGGPFWNDTVPAPQPIEDDFLAAAQDSVVIMGEEVYRSAYHDSAQDVPGKINAVISTSILDRDHTRPTREMYRTDYIFPDVISAANVFANESIIGVGGEEVYTHLFPLAKELNLAIVNRVSDYSDYFPSYQAAVNAGLFVVEDVRGNSEYEYLSLVRSREVPYFDLGADKQELLRPKDMCM